ncbi:interleukin-6 receptor subunit beta-like [Argopecten irradians]|uniref:interleukin-6 receptor subunit beta-like n=1 Tax=Argopecten irradians TaxID=31199 RepID=UPI003723ABA3
MFVRFVHVCLLWIWSLTSVSETCIICCRCGDVSPDDPYVFVNETLEINCTLTSSDEVHNSSVLYLKHGQTQVKDTFFDFPNNRTLLFRKVAEMSDAGNYLCLRRDIDGMMGFVGGQVVKVDYAPQEVTEIQCIWYNWNDRLECSWELPAYGMSDIEIKLVWYNGATGQCPDMNPNKTMCTIQPTDAALDTSPWYFQITVTNTRRNISATGPWIKKKQSENVKPNKVETLGYEYTDNSSCIRLTWRCKDIACDSPHRAKQVRARCVSNIGQFKEVIHAGSNESVLVCDLDPDTPYTCTVDMRTPTSPFYSDPVTIETRTDEEIPIAAPKLHTGAFHRQRFSCLSGPNGYHDVTLFWKAISRKEARGIVVTYKVEISEMKITENIINKTSDLMTTYFPGTSLSGTIKLKCGTAYDVNIRASTKKGFSKTWSYLRIPMFSKQGPALPIVRVEELDGQYELTWTEPSLAVQTGYTVFYCQRRNNTHCKGEMISVDMDGSVGHATVTVPDTETEYLFGLSRNFGPIGSGFDLVSCVYHKNAVPPPPSGITITPKSRTSVMVTWNHVTCSEYAPIIVTYTVSWCMINEEAITEEKNCKGLNVSTQPHQPAIVVLHGLDHVVTYGVQIRSSSSVQTGVFSDSVYINLASKETEGSCPRPAYRSDREILHLGLIVICILIFVACVILVTCCFRNRSRRQKDAKIKS